MELRTRTGIERVSAKSGRGGSRISGEVSAVSLAALFLGLVLVGTAAWYFLQKPPAAPAPETPASTPPPTEPPVAVAAKALSSAAGAVAAETSKHLQAKVDQTRAQSEALQLKTAIMSYFTEYRRYPRISGVTPKSDTNTTSSAELIQILTGENITENPRQIRFFEPRQENLDPSGALVDPWGKPYRVFFDTNYDNALTVDGEKIYTSVEVRSSGPEKTEAEPAAK